MRVLCSRDGSLARQQCGSRLERLFDELAHLGRRRFNIGRQTFLDERFAGYDDKPEERAKVAAEVAAEQIEDLVRRGIDEFHLYTMNRAPLVSAVLDNLGFSRRPAKSAGAAA